MEVTLRAVFKPSNIALIGSGTYANVFKLTDGDNMFVVKYAKNNIYTDTSLAMEWVINSRFTHANFIKITECRRIDDQILLIMPYIGQSIAAHITHNTLSYNDDWPRQLREMATVLRLYNIVHKDISPHNILVHHTDNSRLVLCDFGLANHNNPYDTWLATSLPIKAGALTTLDTDCIEYIITLLAVHAKKNKSTVRQLPRRTTQTSKHDSVKISYVWSIYNIMAIASLTGHSADFINTFLTYTLSPKHTGVKCAAIIDAIINNPVAIYDNTQRLFG